MPTVRDILSEAIPRLEAAGIDSARLDAELLLARVLAHDRGWVWAHLDDELAPAAEAHFHTLLNRRLRREPLAYVLGEWEFYGRAFFVTPDVLVPRPETELLVEAVLAWANDRRAAVIADIGTGSGAIAVTLAAELPALRLLAVDISAAALDVARRNAVRHGVGDRVQWLHGNLLAPVLAAGFVPLDAVVANLPYIAEEEFDGLMPEVRDYEPAEALLAAEGGLALITRLIADAPTALVPGGLLALEVGFAQAPVVAARLTDAGWQAVRIIEDYCGIQRHVLAECGDAGV